MSKKRLELPRQNKTKNVIVSKPTYTEEYKQIVKEADDRIQESKRQNNIVLHKAKGFKSISNNTCVRLYIEDLVGNLYYSLKKRNIDNAYISYKLIDAYEHIIAEELDKLNIRYYFDLSRDKTNDFLFYNNDIYKDVLDERGFSIGIELVKDLPVEYFIYHYQGYLTLDLLRIIIDDNIIDRVVDVYNEELGTKKRILNNVKAR